ncbi:MAG: hypothetical protein COS92_02240 [Desulfobacterales bacterium CG07_land_8_20_14_0_80_52_14]|nr:MAG: hypothetical protein COS92_02240 [Desulfobacterales bacterium CG07_land_8_20_14_0_80_52_14]
MSTISHTSLYFSSILRNRFNQGPFLQTKIIRSNAFKKTGPKRYEIVKTQNWDGKVKSFRCKARKS